jgi:hypothetical protein
LGEAGFTDDPESPLDDLLERMGGVADTVRRLVGLIPVTNIDGALEVLEDKQIEASPIHGVGHLGHAGFFAGAGPKDAPEASLPEVSRGCHVVAVVDSGIAPAGNRPNWMLYPNVLADSYDEEQTYPSHGTHVASVIRQVSPAHAVSLAAAKPIEWDWFEPYDTQHENDDNIPTTELDVFGAIVRLVERHKDHPHEVVGLNLSLGAPKCGEKDGYLIVLREAIEYWWHHMGRNAPVFAPAGNANEGRRVYPAAFPGVRAVAAAEDGGRLVVWDDGPEDAPARSWLTDVAPGVGILGLSGKDDRAVVNWSGSSFASAVACAASSRRAPFEVKEGVCYWQDRGVDYSSIAGLQYAQP